MKIKSVEVIPYDDPPKLFVVVTTVEGDRWCYVRPFAMNHRAHAEYFAQLVRDRGEVDTTNWKPRM